MPKNENGITHYAIGTASVRVAFPNADIKCQNCEFLFNDKGLGRCKCELQHQKIIPLDCIGFIDPECPIKFDEKEG